MQKEQVKTSGAKGSTASPGKSKEVSMARL
jgi:hypothetical protein